MTHRVTVLRTKVSTNQIAVYHGVSCWILNAWPRSGKPFVKFTPHPPSDPPKKAFLVTGIFMLGKRWLGKIMVQIIDQ